MLVYKHAHARGCLCAFVMTELHAFPLRWRHKDRLYLRFYDGSGVDVCVGLFWETCFHCFVVPPTQCSLARVC